MLGTYHLTALFDTLNKIHFVYEPQNLWDFIVEQTCKVLQAETGTFFEVSDNEKQLKVCAAYGVDISRLSEVPFNVGTGISGWVAQFHQPALVTNVREDNRFNRSVDMVTGIITRSVICVPIFSQKQMYGVLEIINRRNGQFGPQDQEFMTLLCRQAAIAYQNLLLLKEVSQTKILMESLVANLSGGLIAMDSAAVLTILNPSAIQLLGLADTTVAGIPADQALKDHPWFIETLQKTLGSQQTVSRAESTITLQGTSQRIGYTTILISDRDKHVLGSGMIFQKLTS